MKRANHKIDWPGLVFFGSAEHLPFVDVEFVTLKQHCIDLVLPEAIQYCAEQNISGDQESIIKAYILTHNEPMQLKEFVSCRYSSYFEKLVVEVGLNVEKIDEEAEDRGLDLLGQVEKFKHGLYQEFGNEYKFVPSESL